MSEKNLRSPDERFQTVKKDTTREYDSYGKNTLRPDQFKAKGELYEDEDEDDDDDE